MRVRILYSRMRLPRVGRVVNMKDEEATGLIAQGLAEAVSAEAVDSDPPRPVPMAQEDKPKPARRRKARKKKGGAGK